MVPIVMLLNEEPATGLAKIVSAEAFSVVAASTAATEALLQANLVRDDCICYSKSERLGV